MGMRRGGWLAMTATIACISCTAPPPGEGGSTQVSADDAAIAAQLYAGAPRTPPGFLADPAPTSFAQVTTYHVKTRQLDAAAATQHEVCTDDWAQALAWSETVAQQAPTYLDLVGNASTERYYEFDRVPHGDTQRYERMRVFRCGYLDRTGVDLNGSADFAGALNARPLDADTLRGLAEYLWEFSEYDNVNHAVVASAARTVTTGLAHTLTLASLETGAMCDRVVLREWTYTADPATGEVHSAIAPLREFSVRRVSGQIAGC